WTVVCQYWTTMRPVMPSCDSGTECSSDCFAKSSERRRQCTNPEPQFGGQPCQSQRSLESVSSWSYCGEDCRSRRHRSCHNPAPRMAAAPATADSGAGAAADKEVRNCTDGQCKKEDPALLRYINGDGKTANLNNLAIYIGLFVAAAVVLTVVMVSPLDVVEVCVSISIHTNGNCSTVSSNDKDVKHTNASRDIQQQQQVRNDDDANLAPVHLPIVLTTRALPNITQVFHFTHLLTLAARGLQRTPQFGRCTSWLTSGLPTAATAAATCRTFKDLIIA
uniref:ADAM_CR_2 domain-containing protein n=1 Tax=Macrostomum lignano TaxID=282301 RepID=A0A1I8FR47_9PLAT